MLCNFFVIWVFVTLLAFVNVSTAADSNTDTDGSAICTDTEHCTCLSDVQCSAGQCIQCSGLPSLDVLPAAPAAQHLRLLDSHIPLLSATLLQHLPQLLRLDAVNCSIQRLTGTWHNPHLEDINLSSNNFSTFELQWLDGLPGLRSLNLSGSPLRSVAGHPPVEARLLTLDLSGGRWNCTEHGMTWLVHWMRRLQPRSLAGEHDTRCDETRKQYRTMDGRRLVDVLRLTDAMLEQCPSEPPFGCSCDLIQVVGPPAAPATAAEGGGGGGPLAAVMVEVFCDNRGLTEFPPVLPDNTTTLYVRNNSLTDFGPVIGNRSGYQALTTLYLDGNLLEADDANQLEGSDFIHRFSILSLSRNRLQTLPDVVLNMPQLPLYAFDNAIQKRSSNVDSLFLGGNPWLCDCDSPFTFSFRTWLASQHKLIRDRADIRCGYGPLAGGPPAWPAVLTLSRHKLCGRFQINWWDLAIGLLASAVAVLTLKFAYDVTVYRRRGELPLVARKFLC